MNWQSWSPFYTPFIKLPLRNFSPFSESIITKKPKNYVESSGATGICTWYRFGKSLSVSKILTFARSFKQSHPEIEFCLIDDGWTEWGDWQSPKFDMVKLSAKLRSLNLKTGLWMAPFLVSERSQLFKNHPEYFVRDHQGKLIDGIKLTAFDYLLPYRKYILDFNNKEAKQYIYNSLRLAITKWNVKLLKLDFLYAPYFDNKLTNISQPHHILQDLFQWIKQEFPDVYLMACGCPFEPAKYHVDSIRISDDIALPHFYKYPLIKNILHRRQLKMLLDKWHNCQSMSLYFHLDPDVLPDQSISGYSSAEMTKIKAIFNESKIKFYG